MKKIWRINKKAPESFLKKFPEYSKLTLQLLWDRGLKTQKAIDEFFNPDYDEDLHDPFLLKGLKKAIKRIGKAGQNKEKVAIFADFDADGICGATILTEILRVFKIRPDIYIPDRNREGYGLNLNSIKEASKKEVNLILTIDCGVTDFEEIKLANKLGMEVIIIDHHEMPKKLPPAFAIINPKQKTCKYPFKHLSATGVAFKLAQAVAKLKKIPSSWEKWLLDLVALATVADSMLLLGENRTLVKYGLIVLSQTKRIGLKALIDKARVKIDNLNTYIIGFVLVPRLNAASRVDHGTIAYNLLVASNKEEAEELAQVLEKKNQERQKMTEEILKEVKQKIGEHPETKKIIIEGDEKWTAGLNGLIAQKLKDEFWRPVLIYQKFEDYSSGSGRSIPDFSLIKVLSHCRNFLKEFGGHHQAAGFKVLNRDLEKFKTIIEKSSSKELKNKKLIPYLEIDGEVGFEDLDWLVFKEIQNFAPFGEANPNPLFLLKGLMVSEARNVGTNGSHLKISLEKETERGIKRFKAIGFNLVNSCDKIKTGDIIDITFELIANEWNGMRELQLKIVDLKKT